MPNLPDILNGVQEAAGSNPVTRTKTTEIEGKTLDFGGFLFCCFVGFLHGKNRGFFDRLRCRKS